MISVFPDEYHLLTLQQLLDVCTTKLHQKVDIKAIFIALMERLADYAMRSDDVQTTFNNDGNIYKLFKDTIDTVILNKEA